MWLQTKASSEDKRAIAKALDFVTKDPTASPATSRQRSASPTFSRQGSFEWAGATGQEQPGTPAVTTCAVSAWKGCMDGQLAAATVSARKGRPGPAAHPAVSARKGLDAPRPPQLDLGNIGALFDQIGKDADDAASWLCEEGLESPVQTPRSLASTVHYTPREEFGL